MEILDKEWMHFTRLQFLAHVSHLGYELTDDEARWSRTNNEFVSPYTRLQFKLWLTGYMQALRDDALTKKHTKKYEYLRKLSLKHGLTT